MANNLNTRRIMKEHIAPVGMSDAHAIENPWKPSIESYDVKRVAAFVSDLEQNLVETIALHGNNSLVVGCVAWFSNPRIVEALAKHCSACLLLVNDENYTTWGNGKTLELYKKLPHIKNSLRELFGHLNSPLGMFDTQRYDPVRCVRNAGDCLMHSKYLVFFKPMGVEVQDPITRRTEWVWKNMPTAVWTGSMNYTIKASRNQENAVLIEDDNIARFYFNDFATTFMQSGALRTEGASSTDQVNNDSAPAPLAPSYRASHPKLYAPKPASMVRNTYTPAVRRAPNKYSNFAARASHVIKKEIPTTSTPRKKH